MSEKNALRIALRGWEIRAVLPGRKTLLVRPLRKADWPDVGEVREDAGVPVSDGGRVVGWHWPSWDDRKEGKTVYSSYGGVGDLLDGLETFAPRQDVDGDEEPEKACRYCLYKADGTSLDASHWHSYPSRWKSPVVMPQWAVRARMRITSLSLTPLETITHDEAERAGAYKEEHVAGQTVYTRWVTDSPGNFRGSPAAAVLAQWDRDYGRKYPRDQFSSAWLIGFELLK